MADKGSKPSDPKSASSASSSASEKQQQQQVQNNVRKIPKVSNPNFDLEGYISNYSGFTRLQRLAFIGERWEEGGAKALKMAVEECKKTVNTIFYKELYDNFRAAEVTGIQRDQEWIDSVEKKTHQQIERLDAEVNQFKAHLVKESIRVAYNDLGDAHHARGDLNMAMKSYSRTRDYVGSPKHSLQMWLSIIKTGIEMQNWTQVMSYVNKADTTTDGDKLTMAKVKCCGGLAHLEGKRYKQAARKLIEVEIELGANYNDVIAPRDVAIYGGLCALATFDRQELKRKVLDNTTFKNFLESVPLVREIINDFYGSRYAPCLSSLDQMKSDLLLDVHLHMHVTSLYQQIRNRALVQYFSPFVSVDLATMAKAFNTEVGGLEKELSVLISEGNIKARIDSHNKVLHAKAINQRTSTFDRALKMGDNYQKNSKSLLLRVSLMKYDFVVRAPQGGQGGGKGGKDDRSSSGKGGRSQEGGRSGDS